MSVVLVGIPASGKSSVAALLSQSLGVGVVETDELVTTALGATPEEIFAHPQGERIYRDAETAACLKALDEHGVIVLGSGAVESGAVRDAAAGHRVIWLRTSVATATRRLGLNLLGMEVLVAIRTKLDAQLSSRAGWYEAVATDVIDTDRISVAEVAAAAQALVGESK